MEEVWEKEDGLDPDSFDPRTFFNLHGKCGISLKFYSPDLAWLGISY